MQKPIVDIALGDQVTATDPATGTTGARPVTALIRHSGPHHMVAITLDNATTTVATDHHPFWDTRTHTYVDATSLTTRDILLDAHGHTHAITAPRRYDADLTAYNLTVNKAHSYYARTTPVLVHNSGCDVPPPNLSPLGAGRRGAFRQAKRDAGSPVGRNPDSVGPNLDQRGRVQPGRSYRFGEQNIREDSGGHDFGPGNPQNRGSHFNGPDGDHYDYGRAR